MLMRQIDDVRWIAISNRTKRLKPGEQASPVDDESIIFTIINRIDDSLEISTNIQLTEDILSSIGSIALPPYIKRNATELDKERYQTVYAKKTGAVASPTAGLHFTPELIQQIRDRGVAIVFLTLQVSWGTFQPVRVNRIENHIMHSEKYMFDEASADVINNARHAGGRIIAVGTTSLRVLESTYHDGINIPGSGETSIFIYPPQKIASIDSLITNFHTPHSTLLMLVSAFAGYENIMDAYKEAVKLKYRFFSYGDAMFIN